MKIQSVDAAEILHILPHYETFHISLDKFFIDNIYDEA